MPSQDCVLCNEIGENERALSRVTNKRLIPIVESGSFMVLPDIQPLVAGHSLLVTKFHIRSFSDLSSDYCDEFRIVFERSKAMIAHRYGMPFLFEHGSAEGRPSGCCVNHAHLHLVPAEAPVALWLDTLIEGNFRPGRGRILDSLSTVCSSYLYYQSQDGSDFVVDGLERPVPSQFMRRAVGKHLGIRNWNWKSVLLQAVNMSEAE